MASTLGGQFLSVVHTSAGLSNLEGQWVSVVHSAIAASLSDLQGQFASVVHTALGPTKLEGQFASVVHASTPAPSIPTKAGQILQGDTIQGFFNNDFQGNP